MATKPAPDWLSFEVVHEPDPEAEVAALVSMIEYSREHRLAEQYPTPEPVVKAVTEREDHYRDCAVCMAGDLCDAWWRLAAVAQRAMDESGRTPPCR